jgi:hypothetical protein
MDRKMPANATSPGTKVTAPDLQAWSESPQSNGDHHSLRLYLETTAEDEPWNEVTSRARQKADIGSSAQESPQKK